MIRNTAVQTHMDTSEYVTQARRNGANLLPMDALHFALSRFVGLLDVSLYGPDLTRSEPFDGFEVPQIPSNATEAAELELDALRRKAEKADALALAVEAEGATMGLAKALAAYRSA